MHALPSLQVVLVDTGVFSHAPVLGLQESAVQGLPSSQLVGAACAHVPSALQESTVQALPSSQIEPNSAQSFSHGPPKS